MNWPAVREAALDWVYPRRCGLCGRLGEEIICEICLDEFKPVDEPVRAGPIQSPLSTIYSIWAYDGRAGQAVRRLKYDSRVVSLAEPMAEMMQERFEADGLNAFDFIVPVPIHRSRLRERGFNQSELLAAKLPKDKVCTGLLRRVKRTRPQVELSAAKRVLALRGAFASSDVLTGKSVLLIDDVVTTGGTALACAETLASHGAAKVAILAFCGERPA